MDRVSMGYCFRILYDDNRHLFLQRNKHIQISSPNRKLLKVLHEHYQYLSLKRTPKALDAQGKLVLYPSTALSETYKMATNPITTVTALNVSAKLCLIYPKNI